jgi:hypothetical protein
MAVDKHGQSNYQHRRRGAWVVEAWVTDIEEQQRTVRERGDRREYQHNYYLSRREELAEIKRRRYAEDPGYRAMIARTSEASRKRKARARGVEEQAHRFTAEQAPGFILAGPQGPMRVYSLATLTMVLGVSKELVRKWRKIGVLPPSVYRLHNGREVYSEHQIAGVAAA